MPLAHVRLRQELQRRERGACIIVRETDLPEQLLLRIDGFVDLVDAPQRAIRQDAPVYPGNGGVGDCLRDPLAVVEALEKRLCLDKKNRARLDQKSVVDRIVARMTAIFVFDIIDGVRAPSQRTDNAGLFNAEIG